MKKLLIASFGILSYLIGLGGLVYFILFLGSWDFMPVHINSATPGPIETAIAINLGLLVLFGLQHSVTARPTFKAALTKFIPTAAERSSYVLLSGIMMLVLSFYWQPIAGDIWRVESGPLYNVLLTGHAIGWLVAIIATFMINHFELFGLQQVYLNFRDRPEPVATFTDRWFYKLVRHPLQLGILLGIWCLPTMTMSHLMLAGGMTLYVFIGLYYEEKDLAMILGPEYKEYQKHVRKILPLPVFNKERKSTLRI